MDGAIVLTTATVDGNCELLIGPVIFNRACVLYIIVNKDTVYFIMVQQQNFYTKIRNCKN